MYEDVLDLFIRHRSIRSYLNKDVEKEKIETILKAALAAPSTANNQPLEMVIVTENNIMDEIRTKFRSANYNAPCAIVVFLLSHLHVNAKYKLLIRATRSDFFSLS